MTTSLLIPSPGDVVTLSFSYLDGTGSKVRPAITLTARQFNETRRYFVFAPITGSAGSFEGTLEIRDLGPAGLNRRSYCHGMLFSANNSDILRIAGHLTSQDLARLRDLLKRILLL